MFSRVLVAASLLSVALGDAHTAVAKPEVASASKAAATAATTKATHQTALQKELAHEKEERQAERKRESAQLAKEKAATHKELADERAATKNELAKEKEELAAELKKEASGGDEDSVDMKALLDKIAEPEFADKLVNKMIDRLSGNTQVTPDTQETKEVKQTEDTPEMKALLDKLGDDDTQQMFADKFVKKMVDKLSAVEMKAPQEDSVDMQALMDKLADEDTQKEFADKFVNRLVNKLFSTALLADAMHPLDLLDSDDSYDAESDASAKARQDEYNDMLDEYFRGASKHDEDLKRQAADEDEDEDDEEELYAQPADEPNQWFALCTPGTLAGAALVGVACAFIVSFVMAFVEKKKRSMTLPTTLLG
jgi:hypothetical protein